MTAGSSPAWQAHRGIATGTVHHVHSDIKAAMVGRWLPRLNPHWTLVWGGAIAYDERLDLPGRGMVEIHRRPRDWALYAPATPFHERMLRPERQRECLWIFFTPHVPLPAIAQRRYTLLLDREGGMARTARAMARAQQAGTLTGDLIAHGYLQVILGLALSAASAAPGDDRGPWQVPMEGPQAHGLLAQVDAQVVPRLSDPPARAEVAAALGMSASTFAHRFCSETGISYSTRVRWLRVRTAKARLADGDASVKRVAAELGFRSPFYFSRVFTAMTGMTPSAYRLALRQGDLAEERLPSAGSTTRDA